MIRFGLQLCAALSVISCLALVAAAQEESKKDPASTGQPAAAKDATHKVKRERLKIEVSLSGLFESDQEWPISLRPESWSAFTVVKAVPHGKKVREGETLVQLDMSKIDEQLQDLETSMQTNRLTLQLAESALELFKTTLPLDLESSARSMRTADEDLNYFLKVGRAFEEESARFSLKSSRQSLEYAEEELKQLEKMYNADDLTEETEEIILKRAKNDVERSQFYLKSSELRTKKMLTQDLPREQQQYTEAARRAEISLAKARATLPVQFEKKQIERDQQLLTNKRTEEKLKELRKDREMMQVKSPSDGVVYHGRCTRGKWSGVESVSSQLTPGGKLSPQAVFMTVVNAQQLHIRVDIPEKELYRVQRGLKGKAVPTGYPELELETTVVEVSPFPISSGVFDGLLRVKFKEQSRTIVPGMACKLTLSVYDKKDAIAVPATAVFEDKVTGERNVVYVRKGDEPPQERTVTIGQKTDQKWEIIEGLQEGEEILLNQPDAS